MRTPPVSYQVRNSNLSLLTTILLASNEMVRPPAPLALAIVLRAVGLGIDQHARIKQAMRIQGRLGCPEGSGK